MMIFWLTYLVGYPRTSAPEPLFFVKYKHFKQTLLFKVGSTISFADGKLTFSCATEEVEYVSEVTCSDVNKYYSNEINLAACYYITVTAMKSGFSNSEIATAKLYWLPTSDIGTNINTAKTRGVVIQSAGGFITLSGLDTNERVDFFTIDGVALGSATATDGTATFSAKSDTIVVAKIGKESVKIALE